MKAPEVCMSLHYGVVMGLLIIAGALRVSIPISPECESEHWTGVPGPVGGRQVGAIVYEYRTHSPSTGSHPHQARSHWCNGSHATK